MAARTASCTFTIINGQSSLKISILPLWHKHTSLAIARASPQMYNRASLRFVDTIRINSFQLQKHKFFVRKKILVGEDFGNRSTIAGTRQHVLNISKTHRLINEARTKWRQRKCKVLQDAACGTISLNQSWLGHLHTINERHYCLRLLPTITIYMQFVQRVIFHGVCCCETVNYWKNKPKRKNKNMLDFFEPASSSKYNPSMLRCRLRTIAFVKNFRLHHTERDVTIRSKATTCQH